MYALKNMLLHIVDYYSKLPVVRKTEGLLAYDLTRAAKILFMEFGFPKKMVSDTGTNFISNTHKQFGRQLNITEHSLILPPQEQWTGERMHKICKVYHKKVHSQ